MSDRQEAPVAAWVSCEICAHALSDHADGDECLANPNDYHGRGDSACPCEKFGTPANAMKANRSKQ